MSTESPRSNAPSILNVVVATPKARGGAIRAGLQFGEHLNRYLPTRTVKMRGKHDELLVEELSLSDGITPIPSNTGLRDICELAINSDENICNTFVWTRLNQPDPLKSYDFVHIHNAVPLWGMVSVALSCKAAGVPYCVTMHGISKIPELPESTNMSKPVKFMFENGFLRPYWWVLRNATHLFALSEGDAQTVRNRFPDQSVSVLPNGVSPNPPSANAQKTVAQEIDIAASTPLLLFVGKLIPGKGIEDLLTAFEQLDHQARLLIVGPCENPSYVERIDNNPAADYLGYVDQSRLDSLYQCADVFVFPTRSDVFPLVTLEAMAAQTPVITTEVGGLPEQITEETGILLSPQTPTELTNALDELLNDEQRRIEMGKNAIERVRRQYSWESIAERAASVYERLYPELNVTRSNTTDRETESNR
ncbi:glycosyltransferase family 4 protein [Natronomonas sp. EA1]|uniref:glycosyltransferase family 4 protein n=1 Tax=Natronomonas sp. EA1 TaxID=3421655 RepID=UPI003EBCCEEC